MQATTTPTVDYNPDDQFQFPVTVNKVSDEVNLRLKLISNDDDTQIQNEIKGDDEDENQFQFAQTVVEVSDELSSLEIGNENQFQFPQVVVNDSDELSSLEIEDVHQFQFAQTVEKVEDKIKGEEEEEEDDEEEEEFSFMCGTSDRSAISAGDVFQDGQIRPVFPLFNRDLLFSDYNNENSNGDFPPRSPVKVFVEAPPHPSSSSSSSDGVAEGPYCSWSKKATEASPDGCKKSNSTGFSKLWRFRDYLDRSNSDGRDAFVFLNNSTVNAKVEEKVVEKSEKSSKKKANSEISSEKKANSEISSEKKAVTGGKAKVVNKKVVKGKTTPLSAHEVYMRNRGSRDDDRRRSYLPYRPELVGFFTNVSGGLSKNVHPF